MKAPMVRSRTKLTLTPLQAFQEACQAVEQVLSQSKKQAGRAASLPQAVRKLWPGALLYACLLADDAGEALGICAETGEPDQPREEALRQVIARHLTGTVNARVLVPLTRADKLPGKALVLQELRGCDEPLGWIGLVLPGAAPAEGSTSWVLLEAFARYLALRLECDVEVERGHTLEAELLDESRRADIAELVGPALHEFSNFLNAVMLTVAVLEMKVPEEMRGDLTGIRRQGHETAALLGQIQQLRQTAPPQPVDLHRAVRDVLEDLGPGRAEDNLPRLHLLGAAGTNSGPMPAGAMATYLDLRADMPRVNGFHPHVKRLCRFLVKNAVAAAREVGGRVMIHTQVQAGATVLRIEDTGPDVPGPELGRLFDAEAPGRPGTSSLELAACASLCKRLRAKLRAEKNGDGGVAMVVEFQASANHAAG
jgi:signal transduction histidine kinase